MILVGAVVRTSHLVAIAALLACAKPAAQPNGTLGQAVAEARQVSRPPVPEAFLTGRDPRFPSDVYVVGVGAGADLEMARRQAVVSISAQLGATIRATHDQVTSAERARGTTGAWSEERESLQEHILQETTFDRPDLVRVADSVTDAVGVRVLCVIDRRTAARALGLEIDAGLARLELAYAGARAEVNPGARLASARELRRLQADVMDVWWLRAAIDGVPRALPPLLADVESFWREVHMTTLRGIHVCVEEGPDAARVKGADALAAALAGHGASVSPCGGSTAPLRLEGRLDVHVSRDARLPTAVFCTTGIAWRLIGAQGSLGGGQAGGAATRQGARQESEACGLSIEALARDIVTNLQGEP